MNAGVFIMIMATHGLIFLLAYLPLAYFLGVEIGNHIALGVWLTVSIARYIQVTKGN